MYQYTWYFGNLIARTIELHDIHVCNSIGRLMFEQTSSFLFFVGMDYEINVSRMWGSLPFQVNIIYNHDFASESKCVGQYIYVSTGINIIMLVSFLLTFSVHVSLHCSFIKYLIFVLIICIYIYF